MSKTMLKLMIQGVLLALLTTGTVQAATRCLPDDASLPATWTKNYPAHRIIGNLYAVGGADLASFLITTDAGLILVNTGLEDSTEDLRTNMETLGFKLEDIKLLLTTQAHFDHVAVFAEIQAMTGAPMWATAPDAPILKDGGTSDPHFGHCLEFRFKPIQVDRILADDETFTLGNTTIRTHLHPGHTEGSASYSFAVRENDRDYQVLIDNMGSINDGKKLLINPTYPVVASDFATTYRKQLDMDIDVWVASHASQYGRDKKYQPGQAYDPDRFVDPDGFKLAVERLRQIFFEQLRAEIMGSD